MILDDYTGFIGGMPSVLYQNNSGEIRMSSIGLDRIGVLMVRPSDVNRVEAVFPVTVSDPDLPLMVPAVLVADPETTMLAVQSIDDHGTISLRPFTPVEGVAIVPGLQHRMANLPACPFTAADWLDMVRSQLTKGGTT